VTLTFDEKYAKVTKYHQNVKFFVPPEPKIPLLSPEYAQRGIELMNRMMDAWVKFDKAGYASIASENIVLDIPAFGVQTDSLEAAWGVRKSLGEKALDPHLLASHVVSVEDRTVKANMQVLNAKNGKTYGLSVVTVTFDEKYAKVTKYEQNVLFFQPPPVEKVVEVFDDPWYSPPNK
jgi:hypothetical protein